MSKIRVSAGRCGRRWRRSTRPKPNREILPGPCWPAPARMGPLCGTPMTPRSYSQRRAGLAVALLACRQPNLTSFYRWCTMKVSRTIPLLLFGASAASLAACGKGPSRQELYAANTVQADSISNLRNELIEQVMEGTRLLNEINEQLAKARRLTSPPRELQSRAELADVNEERQQVVTRINQLVMRLDQVQSRLANARTLLAEKDSALSQKISAYEQMVAEVNQNAERQRGEFQMVIDSQAVKIASLSGQVDTLSTRLGQLTSEKNTVYYVIGSRKELMAKGVLIAEG